MQNLSQKLFQAHLIEGELAPGNSIALRFDQTLCQDATGTLVMLTLEAMNLDRVKTEVSAQYVDHNLLQEDHRNPDDHLFLQSAARRFGLWYSRPGNGISHPLHMQHFGKPGAALLGSDSHTCASGALGMIAIGAGGTDVALAMAGEPIYLKMPKIWGVRLEGELPEWVSAKDIILELLRRHDVDGGVNHIIEYSGPGLKKLSAMDRHVIANMGAELGATTSVFPADEEIQRYLASEGRVGDFSRWEADSDCSYDREEVINLSELEPLIAKPSSPGNVVPVAEVVGEPIYQAYIGSSANPGYRDFAIAAEIVRDRQVPNDVSFDINPSTRDLLEQLSAEGTLNLLLRAGARLHQAGCNGCIGMGQAPASGRNSLRTTPRNFPGRSGTREDRVWLCSPETATASALYGKITDPRTLDMVYPQIAEPAVVNSRSLFVAPTQRAQGNIASDAEELIKGPNIVSLPELDALPDSYRLPVLLRLGDDISTDTILPAGAEVLPYRSNIPKIAEFAFRAIDEEYDKKALDCRDQGGHVIVGGVNYGQGSSREHAALAPRYLGLRVVIAKSFARIHWQNLINFGVLPLTFTDAADYDACDSGATFELENIQVCLRDRITSMPAKIDGKPITLEHQLSDRQCDILLAGGIINYVKQD